MGIFTTFNISDYSASVAPFHAFAWIGFESEGDYSIQLELRTMEGQKLFMLEAVTHIEGTADPIGLFLANLDMRMQNLKLPRPGLYEFVLRYQTQVLGVIQFAAVTRMPQLMQ